MVSLLVVNGDSINNLQTLLGGRADVRLFDVDNDFVRDIEDIDYKLVILTRISLELYMQLLHRSTATMQSVKTILGLHYPKRIRKRMDVTMVPVLPDTCTFLGTFYEGAYIASDARSKLILESNTRQKQIVHCLNSRKSGTLLHNPTEDIVLCTDFIDCKDLNTKTLGLYLK